MSVKNYRTSLLLYFALAYLISWVLWLPLYLPYFNIHSLPVLPFHHAYGAIGPLAAAMVVSYYENRKEGIRYLFEKMILWKVSPLWYFITLICPFFLLAVAALLLFVLNGESITLQQVLSSREFPPFSFATFFLYNVLTFGYGEETGWRGFALPRLENSFTPRIATILLSLGWAGWHIPLFLYRPGYTSMDAAGIAGWILSLFTGSILLSWIYRNTQGSILLAALFHATIDIVFTSQASSGNISNYLGFLITVWGIGAWFWLTKKDQAEASFHKH